MWILFRLLVAVAAFAARQFETFVRREDRRVAAGDGTVLLAETVHKGKVTEYFVGVELKTALWFRLHRETGVDRWFKRLGFATEAETRDRAFDDFVYIVCDHPMLPSLLRRSADARRLIRQVLQAGVTHIEYRGDVVWCSMKREPTEDELSLVAELGRSLLPLEKDFSGRFSDPFLWKALVAEGAVWSIAAYGAGGWIEALLRPVAIHVSEMDLILPGLALAAGLFVALMGVVWLSLGGSSRGHRLIIESAVVLLLGLPAGGVQLFADLNRSLDGSAEEVRMKAESCVTRVTRSRRGRTTTTHYLRLTGSSAAFALPPSIKVVQNLCGAANPGTLATITLGRGAFGHPWYRRITVGPETWSP